MPGTTIRKPLQMEPRYVQQNARTAIRDIYDAIVELVTNADDAYVAKPNDAYLPPRVGRIEIEVERRRKGSPSLLRVRDFARGITFVQMDEKLAKLGSRRHSGLAEGAMVRGTNSRGAKDVMALGEVSFESIASDGRYARCSITPDGYYQRDDEAARSNFSLREKIGISKGTGTLVTIEVDPSVQVPQHETLLSKLRLLVPLREVLNDSTREVWLVDLTQGRRDRVQYEVPEGTDRVKEQLRFSGHPGAEAKLVIKRAKRRLEGQGKFREGWIVVKSRRAVHEATLFANDLEHDPHAAWFFGTLRCEYIDELWNQFDERAESSLRPDPKNPILILDPLRQGGLRHDHPFIRVLFQECLRRLRPLVDEERKREEAERAHVESDQTRQRLNALEKAASRFMEDMREDEEDEVDPNSSKVEGGFQRHGFGLSPPFAQLVVGQRQRFWLNVSQARYPELADGAIVQVTCETGDVVSDRGYCPLEPHPTRENTLRCTWEVRGERVCQATGVTARVGPIVASAPIEVIACERDRYTDVVTFRFERDRYRATGGTPKRVRLLAPSPGLVTRPTPVRVKCDDARVQVRGDHTMRVREELAIADCKLQVTLPQPDMKVRLVAEIEGHAAATAVVSGPPQGEPIKIKIEDIDLGNQRSRWRTNLLEIAGRHPSIRRYLLSKAENFAGQEKTQFRVLLLISAQQKVRGRFCR